MWQTFGHEYAKNAFDKQLLAEEFSHAYLFEGPAGVGKFSVAKEFAKKIAKADKARLDVLTLDLADQTSVEEVREFLKRTSYSPVAGDKLVAIINNMQLANKFVANALLKSLEEPPSKTIFILVSSSKTLLPTILSRTQIVHFNNFTNEQLMQYAQSRLKHALERHDEKNLAKLIAIADGSITALENMLNDFANTETLIERIESLHSNLQTDKYYQRLLSVNQLAELDGLELKNLISSWVAYLKNNFEPTVEIAHSIRLAWQLMEKINSNFNKKMALQHFLVNAKI